MAGCHLFPDFIGGQNEEARKAALEASEKLLKLLMENKGVAKWLAGDALTLADYFLGPITFYVSLTPDAGEVMSVPGIADWWAAMKDHETFAQTEPDLG